MRISIYHNSKCSKSRETLKLLRDRGIEPEIINYLTVPPTAKGLSNILTKLGIEARNLVRFKEAEANKLGISPSDKRSEEEWVKLMIENPILIERPIVIASDRAVIGRPPENVLKLINQ
jgi:arsenate reductase (glutaredoxin)